MSKKKIIIIVSVLALTCLPIFPFNIFPVGQLIENQLIDHKVHDVQLPQSLTLTYRGCGYNGIGDVVPQCNYAYASPPQDRKSFEQSLKDAYSGAGYTVFDDYHDGDNFYAKGHGIEIDVAIFPYNSSTGKSNSYGIPVEEVGIIAKETGIGVF